jgi:hypothetical protein
LLAQWQCTRFPSWSCRFDPGAGLVKERTKRLRGCSCNPKTHLGRNFEYQKVCHWGNCTEWRCYGCHGLLGGVGEIWCPCDGGAPRSFRHPGMENRRYRLTEEYDRVYTHAAVKPSKAHRHQVGKHNR